MSRPGIDQWDVAKMAKSHYAGDGDRAKQELWKFIKEFLTDFSLKGTLKSTNITISKIGAFHTYVEKRFKNDNEEYSDDDVGSWTLAFMVYWYRNRGYVDDEKIDDEELSDAFENNRAKFYNTMLKEWRGQRRKGSRTDSVLEYTTTHPKLSKNPYFTIPMRLEYVRRLRTYWSIDENILFACRSQLRICKAELENLQEEQGPTCSTIPGTRDCMRLQLKMQNLLTDGKEASGVNVDRIDIDNFIERKNEHEKTYADVMRFWQLIGHSRDTENRLDGKDFAKREGKVRSHINKIKNKNHSLAEYLTNTWKSEFKFLNSEKKAIRGNRNLRLSEEFLLLYFDGIKNHDDFGSWTSKDKDRFNRSLRNSIFRHTDSAYPVKTPSLTKIVRSANKISLKQQGSKLIEDKTTSSLINDCRDSAKLAMFLLEKIQVRSAGDMNKHISLLLWDLMFRFSKYLDVPTFSKIRREEVRDNYQNSENNNRMRDRKYIQENDENIAKELQDMIDNVFRRAQFILESTHPTGDEKTHTILNSIIEEWSEYIQRPLIEKPYLGTLRERCGNLIYGPRGGSPKSTLIFFRPEQWEKEGCNWKKALEYTDAIELQEGELPIWRPRAGERAGYTGYLDRL